MEGTLLNLILIHRSVKILLACYKHTKKSLTIHRLHLMQVELTDKVPKFMRC